MRTPMPGIKNNDSIDRSEWIENKFTYFFFIVSQATKVLRWSIYLHNNSTTLIYLITENMIDACFAMIFRICSYSIPARFAEFSLFLFQFYFIFVSVLLYYWMLGFVNNTFQLSSHQTVELIASLGIEVVSSE